MAKLDNFSLYLWNNGPEGYHITVTLNYNTTRQRRCFISFGKQTYRSWRAYNENQPPQYKDFFANFKQRWRQAINANGLKEYWISKMGMNTGNKGRVVAETACILFNDDDRWGCIIDFAGEEHKVFFDEIQRLGKKGTCIGEYRWNGTNNIQGMDVFS